MREVTTTALDILGLLLIVAGLVGFIWQWVGPAAFVPGGFVVLVASHWVSRPERVKTSPSERVHW